MGNKIGRCNRGWTMWHSQHAFQDPILCGGSEEALLLIKRQKKLLNKAL